MISVIPAIVQSSLKVYLKCQELLVGFGDGGGASGCDAAPFLSHAPNLRDVFRLVEGCSKIPKVGSVHSHIYL